MRKKLDIKINDPCGENWQNFRKEGATGYCQNCQKHVVDFATKSDQEIFDYFKRNRGKVCGRFSKDQLRSYYSPKESSTLSKAAIVTAGIIKLSNPSESSPSIYNGIKPLSEISNIPDPQSRLDKIHYSQSKDSLIIRGKVISDDDGSSLPGVNVVLKGTSIGATTDVNGEFELHFDNHTGNPVTLIFSFIGLQTVEYKISDNAVKIEIGSVIMKVDVMQLGEVCITRWWTPRGIWLGIKNVFTKR